MIPLTTRDTASGPASFNQRGDGVVEGWATGALDFARTEKRLGTVPIIERQNVGFALADIKMRIEACRYLIWKACRDFDHTHGLAEELPIITAPA